MGWLLSFAVEIIYTPGDNAVENKSREEGQIHIWGAFSWVPNVQFLLIAQHVLLKRSCIIVRVNLN